MDTQVSSIIIGVADAAGQVPESNILTLASGPTPALPSDLRRFRYFSATALMMGDALAFALALATVHLSSAFSASTSLLVPDGHLATEKSLWLSIFMMAGLV